MRTAEWITLALACATPAQGPFPVGNGRVVAVLGIEGPAHAVHALRCAHDHADGPARAGAWLELSVEGRAAGWSAHGLRRHPGAAICISEDRETEGLVLRTRVFAPPGADHLVQILEVHNRGDSLRRDVALRVRATGAAGCTLTEGEDGTWRLGDLAPGQVRGAVLTVGVGAKPPELDPAGAEAAATATVRHWHAQLAGALRVTSDPPRFAELVDGAAVALLALRCATCGGLPADERSGAIRVRDTTGPLLAFLRLGLQDEARDLLRFHFARHPDGVDWNALRVPDGDLSTLVVLQHYWYFRATADLEPVRAHWPLLEACLKNVSRGADGLGQQWNYAESALFVQAVAALGALHVACGADGDGWARRSGELLHAMERRYWRDDARRFAPERHRTDPVGEINLLPLWSGQLAATGDRTRDNLRHTLARLWRNGARIGSSPTDRTAPGELQGMVVAALTQFEGRGRRAALDALCAMAEPPGTWGAHYGADGRPLAPRGRLSTSATGVNIDAALFAVTGLRYAAAPGLDEDWLRLRVHLPLGTRSVHLRGIVAGGRRLNLELAEERGQDPGDHRLRFSLTPRSLPGGRQIAVVQCMGVQFQRRLEIDETVTQSAAWRAEPERFLPLR